MVESSAVHQPENELDETARIARDLIRIDTTNHGEGRAKGEREAAEYVEAKLADLGLEELRLEAHRGEPRLDVLGSLPFPVRTALAVIGRVEADEISRDDGGFVEVVGRVGRVLSCG